MDIASVLEKHNLDLATVMSSEGLVKLSKAYEELLATLSADTETQQNREKQTRDEMLSKFPGIIRSEVADEIRNSIAISVNENPDTLPALCEMLQSIKQDLMVMRDFHVQSVVRDNKPEKVKDSEEIETRKEEASSLKEAIVSVWNLLGKPTDIEGFATKKSEKTNEISPDLPRVPNTSVTGAIRGRGAKVRQMQFEVDGKMLPAGMLFYDIVSKYVCDFADGYVVKPSDIVAMINDANERDPENNPKFTTEGYENKWTIQFPTVSLSGWLPVEK